MSRMDYTIKNFAPDSDVIQVTFTGSANKNDKVIVTVERDTDGTVTVHVQDRFDEKEHRLVLGQYGFTDKL